ncbi:hypothetical protein EVS84_23335 [Pseudomonas koreensis]|uniref:Uncharacterized protein n=1 Tax=Pseudomonas koreensis TaxID=198620 RepID=A0A4Q4L1G0_9PSED|nr:hypothetical protein EVS84_23335 [Pseudomonas koreensis]
MACDLTNPAQKNVGVSLLAKRSCQSIQISTDRSNSRAGSLPQFGLVALIAGPAPTAGSGWP